MTCIIILYNNIILLIDKNLSGKRIMFFFLFIFFIASNHSRLLYEYIEHLHENHLDRPIDQFLGYSRTLFVGDIEIAAFVYFLYMRNKWLCVFCSCRSQNKLDQHRVTICILSISTFLNKPMLSKFIVILHCTWNCLRVERHCWWRIMSYSAARSINNFYRSIHNFNFG